MSHCEPCWNHPMISNGDLCWSMVAGWSRATRQSFFAHHVATCGIVSPIKTLQPWKFPRWYHAKVNRGVRNWSSKSCYVIIPLSIPMFKLSAHFTFTSRAFGQWTCQPLSPKIDGEKHSKIAILSWKMMMFTVYHHLSRAVPRTRHSLRTRRSPIYFWTPKTSTSARHWQTPALGSRWNTRTPRLSEYHSCMLIDLYVYSCILMYTHVYSVYHLHILGTSLFNPF